MTYISADLRRLVIERAEGCCEYCRMNVMDRLLPYQIDHIRAEKHGGTTDADNLCLACYRCNGFKGSDIASIDPQTDTIAPLFHPRRQHWDDHFQLDQTLIEPLTPEGRVTVALLRLNAPIQIAERRNLLKEGRYPCPNPARTSP